MRKEEVRVLLNLDSSIDVIKVEENKEKEKKVKYVYIKSNKKKARSPKCGKFSNKLHDYLKPNKLTYLKNTGIETYLIVQKRRFDCINCKKSFTEDLGISQKNCSISSKTKQLILKECMDRDKTLVAISKDCNTSVNVVRETRAIDYAK